MKKLISLMTLSLFISSCGLRKAVTASFAKEFCSCVFVEQLPENKCTDFATYVTPVSSYILDKTAKSVQATFLFETSLALYEDARFGCRLEQ